MNENTKKLLDAFIEALAADEAVVAYRKAKEEYARNGELMNRVVEYNAQSQALETENSREKKDTLLITSMQKRVKELYDSIIADPCMIELNQTEQVVNEILTAVNVGLQTAVAPETLHEHHDCGGDCGHCGGCH